MGGGFWGERTYAAPFLFGRLEGFRVCGILGAYSPFPARRIKALAKKLTETSANKWVGCSIVFCVSGVL